MLAIAIGAITWMISIRVEVSTIPVPTPLLSAAGQDLQTELDRLFRKYMNRLEQVESELGPRYSGNPFRMERAGSDLVGVHTVSWLYLRGSGEEQHVRVLAPSDGESLFDLDRFPDPRRDQGIADSSTRLRAMLDEQVSASGPGESWLSFDERVIYRVSRFREEGYWVIGIDAREWAEAVSDWLSGSEEREYLNLPLRSEGSFELRSPEGSVVWGHGERMGLSSDVVAASVIFGTWQLHAWGVPTKTVRIHHVGLALGLLLAVASLIGSIVLGETFRRASRLAEQRVSFVNQASHELRSPITNILLNTDLADDLVTEDPIEASRRLKQVKSEASRLSRLIDNLLTFSKRGAETEIAPLSVSELNPTPVIEGVLEQFEPSLEARNCLAVFMPGSSGPVRADEDALTQILNNLLSNAEKYGSSGGRIELESSVSGEWWELAIRDYGPGVAASARPKLFEPFYRAKKSVNEGVSGTGLGLAIARDLAEAMGGTLEHLPSDEGAIFSLRLPAIA
ncbi:MAG: HAMP domain-containing sensor histidine kinase [Verrucomicrobiota bacterium]